MAKLKELSPNAWAWMNNIPRHQWSRAFFREHSKCDILLNNLSEVFNKFILDARDKPIMTCLELIRTMLMVRVANKREAMERWSGRLCPRITKKLEIIKSSASSCSVLPAGLMEYQVNAREGQFSVHLGMKTCSCRKWQLTGLPCAHACAVLARNGNSVEDASDSVYSVETYRNVYNNIIHPVRSMDQWEDMRHAVIVPPAVAPPRPGRPKKKRRRGVGEEPPRPGRLRRIGMVMHCRKCGDAGHNKRKCTNPGSTRAAAGSTSGAPAPSQTTG